jgi:hypothetical protein
LHADGPLFVFELRVLAGALVGLKDAFSGHKLGDHDVGAEFLANAAEDHVRHSRHGREVEWKGFLG